MKSLFQAKEYRKYLKLHIKNKLNGHGILTEISKAINCQNSYLTRVLNEEVHLTPDQAYLLTIFLKFNDSETKYFLKLVEFERAGNLLLRNRLKEELDQLVTANENLATRYDTSVLNDLEKAMTYYSAWYWSAIHILTDIPEYQSAEKIAKRLGLEEIFVVQCLKKLEQFDLVKSLDSGRWQISSTPMHLPKTSPMISKLHSNWRQKAITDSENPDTDGLHFSIVQTISHQDVTNIKQLIFETIDRYKAIAGPSKAEDMICFNLDFFKVRKN